MKASLANRLSSLYAFLLGVTIIVVIIASSVALMFQLAPFTRDFVIAKHEEARTISEEYRSQGMTLAQAAPEIVHALSGIGLSVAVFDDKGKFLAGDPTLHPAALGHALHGPNGPMRLGPGAPHRFVARPPLPPGPQPYGITPVEGGYVAFSSSLTLLLVALKPYWIVVLLIATVAIALSWFVGRLFATQALRPINEVTGSLRALADGDFTPRQFLTATGDEIGTLTAAFNDAVAGVNVAINERRQTEERMRQFVADAGHELRTPLTVIGGYIDVLRRGAIEEPTIARQILGTMGLEKEHMRGLIDRLMRLARLDSETPPRQEAIDLAELLGRQCDAARRLDETRTVDYSVEGVSQIVGDRGELGEALWNVVENALKYSEAPIHLRAVPVGRRVQITVHDDGPGMPESERLHAFERFYRGDQRGEISGSGLGLSIAKRAVERAGGSISLESAPGHGTTVNILI